MKSPKFRKTERLLMLSVMFLIIGCASKPATIDLPADHPANPQAGATAFTLPQNFFKTDFTAMQEQSTSDSTMNHEPHEKQGQQHMDHGMQGMESKKNDGQPGAESMKKSVPVEGGHQHQEHTQ